MRLLCILRGPVPPPSSKTLDRFFHLSESLEGEILLPVWYRSGEETRSALGQGSYPVHEVRKFRYHFLPSGHSQGVLQAVAVFLFYLRTGMRLHRKRRFDCIVASGHTMTAFAGTILKLLTRTRLIVEVIGTPRRAYCFENPTVTVRSRLKKLYSDVLLHVNLLSADRVRLLYPAQLDGYPLLRGVPRPFSMNLSPCRWSRRPKAARITSYLSDTPGI